MQTNKYDDRPIGGQRTGFPNQGNKKKPMVFDTGNGGDDFDQTFKPTANPFAKKPSTPPEKRVR